MTDAVKSSPKGNSVRALTRGLAILRYINSSGECRPGEIARALNIPRPTIYRLLETLEGAGYVAFSSSSNLVRVTRLTASLGDASAVHSELCQATGPLFAEYSSRLVWPLDLSVYENASMVIQETTHGRSPLSIDRAMIGYRLPMLRTSAGRAYLAFCPEIERQTILEHLRYMGDPADAPFLEPAWLDRMLHTTHNRGVALRDAGEFRPETSSVAAPIKTPKGVAGTVSVIWIRSAMKTSTALDTLAPQIVEVAEKISDILAS